MMEIDAAREQIDQIDRKITELFCQRMQCSAVIGAYKAERNLPIHVPEREEEILSKLASASAPDIKDYVEKLYRYIFSLSRDYQHTLTSKEG